LEFFVMLSCLVGVGGGTSQANYAVGSTFQDAFARYRCSQGLPAVSIDLGAIDGVSSIAENNGGYEPISVKQATRLIESAMLKPRRSVEFSQLITGICNTYSDSDTKDETMNVTWKRRRRFWPLQRSSSLLQGDNGSADKPTSVGVIKDYVGAAKS
jgi:hypothetical protein